MAQRKLIFFLIKLIALFILAGVAYFGVRWYSLKNQTENQVTKATEFIGMVADARYESLAVNPFTEQVTLSGISINPKMVMPMIHIDALSYSIHMLANHLPELIDISAHNVETSVPTSLLDPRMEEALTALDLTSIKGDFTLHLQYNDVTHMLLGKMKLTLQGAGELAIGVVLDHFNGETRNREELSDQARMKQGYFEYRDAGFVKKCLAFAAQKQKVDANALMASIDAALNTLGNNDLKARVIAEKFMQFLEKPQRILITLNPSKPVAMQELQGMSTAAEFEYFNPSISIN